MTKLTELEAKYKKVLEKLKNFLVEEKYKEALKKLKNYLVEAEYKEALKKLKKFLTEKKEKIIEVITKGTYDFLIKDLIEQIDNKYEQSKIINFLDIRQRFFNIKMKLENDFNDPIITIYDEEWFIDLKKEFEEIFEETSKKIDKLYKIYIKNGLIN